MPQPIIRGIQAVGAVDIYYKYNGDVLSLNTNVMRLGDSTTNKSINTNVGSYGVKCAGFRLDSTFLDANPQIASSFMIPILGGGAVALTNNNRSGVLTINTTRVSTPSPKSEGKEVTGYLHGVEADGTESAESTELSRESQGLGTMFSAANGLGIVGSEKAYDLTFLLQAQQGQSGGDSVGSTITIVFAFNGLYTAVQFQGCTVANIKPLALSGNDAVDYAASINYLNWTVNYSDANGTPISS